MLSFSSSSAHSVKKGEKHLFEKFIFIFVEKNWVVIFAFRAVTKEDTTIMDMVAKARPFY